jgi:hypothetical protein
LLLGGSRPGHCDGKDAFYTDKTVEVLYSLFQLGISSLPIVFVRYNVKKQIQCHRVVGLKGGCLSTKGIYQRFSELVGHTKALDPIGFDTEHALMFS